MNKAGKVDSVNTYIGSRFVILSNKDKIDSVFQAL